MADKQLRLVLVGDATSVQKALASMDASLGTSDAKVKTFGTSFLKMGLALEAGRMALQLFQRAAVGAISAVTDYNVKVEQSEKIILGVTKSHEALAAAQAAARQQEEAGLATYQNAIGAFAELIPLANRYGENLQDLAQTQQILAAADPEQGLVGAVVALREALSGNFLSLERRFEIPKKDIQALVDEGVPNLKIVQKALADLGYDQQFLSIANDNAAKKWEIFKGKITETAAVVEKPFLDVLIAGVEKLDHVLQSGGGKSFISLMVQDIQAITTGHFLDQWAVTIGQVLFLLADASNKITETLTFGKVTIFSDEDMRNFRDNIIAAQDRITTDIQDHIAQPIADGLSGKKQDSPIAPTKLEGYGRDIIQAFLNGLTSAQVGDFESFTKQFEDLFKGDDDKVDTARFTQATAVLAQALQDVKDTGQITAKTFYDLAAIFGDNTLNVATLTERYGQQVAAQDQVTASAKALEDQKKREQQVINNLANDLKPYKTALDEVTAAEEAHANAAADALEPLQDELKDIGDAASEAARESSAFIQGLQDAADQHAAANKARIEAAQAEVTAASEHRQREAELEAAAVAGTTDEYLARLPVIDEETRKLAAKYDAMVAGERRAKDAADNRVNALSVKAHKEDLGLLEQIKAARDRGDTHAAANLESRLKKQRDARKDEEELAAAQAAVADDEFAAAKKRADAEAEKDDEKNAKDEAAAKTRLDGVQAEADAQAAADAAAIKGAQDAAKADADRYAAQQRGIQAEIDRIQDAAKEQAKKDAAAKLAAQKAYDDQKDFNDKIALSLKPIDTLSATISKNHQDSATAAKELYDWVSKLYAIYAANPPGSPGGPPLPPAVGPGARDEHSGAGQATPGGATLADNAEANRQGAIANWLSYYGPVNAGPAMSIDYTPPGFHTENGATGLYWVRDGYALDPSGTVALPVNQQPTSTGTPTAGGRGGTSFLRADGGGAGAAPNGGAGTVINLYINAPNLTDAGNPAQQRALASQVGEAARREWDRLVRGGG